MKARIYHNPRCSKSRATLALLEEREIDVEIVDYLARPPTADEIRHLLKLLKLEPIDLIPTPPAADPYDGGIYFDCTCGGPMWVGADLAGATGKCRYCGRRLVVPHLSGQKARSLTPTGELPKTAPPRPPAGR